MVGARCLAVAGYAAVQIICECLTNSDCLLAAYSAVRDAAGKQSLRQILLTAYAAVQEKMAPWVMPIILLAAYAAVLMYKKLRLPDVPRLSACSAVFAAFEEDRQRICLLAAYAADWRNEVDFRFQDKWL